MLIIISDIHLSDGTCGKPISPAAFQLLADRLEEMVENSSRPIKSIDILLLGDILDPLHSTLWLENEIGQPGYVRPWTDFHAPEYAAMLGKITQAIFENNKQTIAILKSLARHGIPFQPIEGKRKSTRRCKGIHAKVRLYYMVGNHDWYYHLPGPAFERIRADIIQAFDLSNPPGPFPHHMGESEEFEAVINRYKVHARHGDLYDPLNYNAEIGRDASTPGDAFSVEILNRFPVEVQRQLGSDMPPVIIKNLRELVNVRPALAAPLWVSSQLRQNNVSMADQKKLKQLWDGMGREFLKLDIVRSANTPFKLDARDKLDIALHVTDIIPYKAIDDLAIWLRKRFGSAEEGTFAHNALKERTFLDRTAQFIVYGHTHHHEIVPLDSISKYPRPTNQIYFNTGTWHPYYDLAIYKPKEQKFIPYQVLTYLAFYAEDERQGRLFETWSGAFSD
jgi:UDP-2,3-diacylglucosamine pyrophosphatase LpxH